MRSIASAFALVVAALIAAPAQARWQVVETRHFRVYSEGSEKGLRNVGNILEGYWSVLDDLTGVEELEPQPRLDIYLVPDVAAMRKLVTLPSAAAGIYVTGSTKTLALALETSGYSETNSIQSLFHEVAHHFMFQNRMGAYPPWYVEGFAEYMATTRIGTESITVGNVNPGVAYTLNSQPWIEPADFFTRRSVDLRAPDIDTFYSQSWLTVHYLFRNPAKTASLRTYLRQANEGKVDEAAFRSAFGTDFNGFRKDLRGYFSGGKMTMSRYRRNAGAAAAVVVRALPESADELLLLQARLWLGVTVAERPAVLGKVRAEAAKYPGDAFAQAVLAHAEVDLGDVKVGIGLLDALLASDPTNAELLTLRGVAALAGKDIVMGRRLLARAHKLDPVDAVPLFRYGMSFAAQEAKPSENTLNVLLLASSLAPQAPGITLSTASVLIRAKRLDEAVQMLLPIANSPHGGSQAATASRMIAAARAGMPTDPIATIDLDQ